HGRHRPAGQDLRGPSTRGVPTRRVAGRPQATRGHRDARQDARLVPDEARGVAEELSSGVRLTFWLAVWSRIMAEVIAGIRIPDSKLARDATDLLRDHGTPLLLAHSLRVYLFGALRGRAVDHELLYLGAVSHDLGLTAKYRSPDHR